ncbi:hypothetical protein NDU88_005852 [Pleurodeles waltl]|uniref:Uncharacterized protein n=1 Tax=Pleurodeles waltl TaxID=8319 RepID=A0AAV7RNK4_PLEWA|nr:hypothetical protein NDU88_005852 [Pleurodeles waltl]
MEHRTLGSVAVQCFYQSWTPSGIEFLSYFNYYPNMQESMQVSVASTRAPLLSWRRVETLNTVRALNTVLGCPGDAQRRRAHAALRCPGDESTPRALCASTISSICVSRFVCSVESK